MIFALVPPGATFQHARGWCRKIGINQALVRTFARDVPIEVEASDECARVDATEPAWESTMEPMATQRLCGGVDSNGDVRRRTVLYGADGSVLVSIDGPNMPGWLRWMDLPVLPSIEHKGVRWLTGFDKAARFKGPFG